MAYANPSDVPALRAVAVAFAREHLAACARDLVTMQDTAVLPDGRFCELIALCKAYAGDRDGQSVAEAEVKYQAIRSVASLA